MFRSQIAPKINEIEENGVFGKCDENLKQESFADLE
jgi:hypothetical protein